MDLAQERRGMMSLEKMNPTPDGLLGLCADSETGQ